MKETIIFSTLLLVLTGCSTPFNEYYQNNYQTNQQYHWQYNSQHYQTPVYQEPSNDSQVEVFRVEPR